MTTAIRGRRMLSVIVAAIVLGGSVLVLGGAARAHSGDALDATWATTIPVIDGTMTLGEWADAERVDLGAIPGNYVLAFLLVKNNDSFLWVAYDAVGDDEEHGNDTASFALDTGHDTAATDGREDQFVSWFNGMHLVFSASNLNWTIHDSPIDQGLPDHAGLAIARGFGSSDLSNTSHRTYEFQIPLALLRASPGDTLGLFGGSYWVPGVYDAYKGYSTWPKFVGGPIPLSEYGDLTLATPPGPVGVVISPSYAKQFADPGTSVNYTLIVRNTGTGGADVFDMTGVSLWSVTFWDSSGLALLPDTDGDLVPDTGSVPSGTSFDLVARVSLPPTAAGCEYAVVNATSSVDTNVSDYTLLDTCTAAASFSPPHDDYGVDTDSPPNGRYDELDVAVHFSVSQADFYGVLGTLWSGDGSTFVDQATAGAFFGPGNATAVLVFRANRIVGAGRSGPYLVDLDLYDGLYVLIDKDLHTTQPYNVSAFDVPAAVFSPPHSDRGIDTDVPPNGKFDFLELNVSFLVGDAGLYPIEAELYDAFGRWITVRFSNQIWSAGPQVLTLAFDGLGLYLSQADGPYRIELYLYDSSYFFLEADTHYTGPYDHTDFDPPPIEFAPPHSDRGVDTDAPPDGLYDWLVISTRLNVNQAGLYEVAGYLYGPGGFIFLGSAETVANLSLGPTTVDLNFSSSRIRREQVSGNYQAYLVVYALDTNASDYDLYTTSFYDFRQFQPPAGLFAPPHSDAGIDASDPPDGLFDWLELRASVDVSRAGEFRVEAYVFDAIGDLLALADGKATLPTGLGAVTVLVDGHDLGEGSGGSFLVYLFLYDEDGLEIDEGSYFTGPYRSEDFQPSDLAAPSSVASVGGYWRNGAPVRVDFTATDPVPSDGVASVTLWSRYSPNNVTWFPWAPYETKSVPTPGDSQVSGSFLFDFPQGEGFYEVYTVAEDFGGNPEGSPAQPDARFGAFIPDRLKVSAGPATITAGGTLSLTVSVVNGQGAAVVLEAPMTITLLTTSVAGEFRAPGTPTVITTVTIPAGSTEASVDYTDTRAGTATLTLVAAAVEPGIVAATVTPAAAASVTLDPSDVALAVGGSVTFAAGVWDTYGNPISTASIAWTVEGGIGTITSGGVFTAGTTTGAGAIVVESGGLVARSNVVLLPGAPDHLEVVPGTASLFVGYGAGDELVIHVRALDPYGNEIPNVAYSWSLSGPGRLSATTGDTVVLTATGAGTITVTVGSGSETATATITARTPPTPDSGQPVAAIGIGGALVGLVIGFAVGWGISRRRGKGKREESPPEETT